MVTTEERSEVDESADWMARARGGEAEAFCTLAQRHEQRLFRQALALCRDASTAEDLVAETLVEAWKSLARFDESCRLSTWLYSILLHRYQKTVRKGKSRPVLLSSLESSDAAAGEEWLARVAEIGPLPAEILCRDETAGRFLDAISTLPKKHREVVLLRFYEDASLAEIASALGLSLGTVKSRMHHAMEKLRRLPTIVNLLHESRES